MNILILVHGLSGGGAEHVAALWANGFSGNGHSVTVIVNKKPNDLSYPVLDKVYVKTVDWCGGNKLTKTLNRIKSLRNAIKDVKPDVIITVMHPQGFYAYISTLGMHIPIINTEHNTFERPEGLKWDKVELFQKFHVNKWFDAVTVLTNADKSYIGKRLKRVEVLPNPLAFEPVSGIVKKKKIILAMCRLDEWRVKGVDVLLEAWGRIENKYPEWKLQIGGGGEPHHVNEIVKMCRQLGLESRVDFLGHVNNPVPIYRDAEIFAFPSRCDGFGMVLVEAMSQGCACVSCDYKGRQGEIICNEDQGILVPIDDVNAFSKALDTMIKDDETRRKIQVKSIERARDYSLEKIMNIWDNILKINK